jgi:hypothetical protein
MDAVLVIKGLTAAVEAAQALYNDYQAGRTVLSESDAQAVHQALLDAEAATAALRPIVDDALDRAAKS